MSKLEEVAERNKSVFIEFVNTFGNDINSQGACSNYAKFSGFSKSTISKYLNGLENIHPVHFTIMRLVNDRQTAMNKVRKLNKQIKELER